MDDQEKPSISANGRFIKRWSRRQTLLMGGAATVTLALNGCGEADDTAEVPSAPAETPPAETPPASPAREKFDVVIIGAGLSGLNAAMILEGEGAKVKILEGNTRIGGRVYTMDDLAGKPEAGGVQIGPMYARVRSMIDQLGLQAVPPSRSFPENVFMIGGEPVRMADWATSPLNKTVGPEKAVPPFALANMYVTRNNPLSDLDSWLEADASQYDIPFDQYLKSKGASDEAMRLIALPDHGSNLKEISTLYQFRKDRLTEFERENGMFDFLEGGMTRLPEAMAAQVQSEILMSHKVTSIENGDDLVTIRTENGSAFDADFVVASVPFSVLREINFEPGLTGPQAQAVNELPYSQVTQAFFDIKEPYWEEDGLPASMFTDSPLERLWTLPGPDSVDQHLWVFVNGDPEKRLRSLSDEESMAFVEQELYKLRPSTEGRVEPRKIWSWSRNPYSRGAYAYFAPGQVNAFRKEMALPAGRVHFCGEHTADLHSGMEGAMESGERVGYEVLERITV